jgi:hypothetical protein
MFYGFGPEVEGYDEEKAWELANKLSVEFDFPTLDGNAPRPVWLFDGKKQPYIEVNGLVEGVVIRRITNLSEEKRKQVVSKADELFIEVMRGE